MLEDNLQNQCICTNEDPMLQPMVDEQRLHNTIVRARECTQCGKPLSTVETSLKWEQRKQSTLEAMLNRITEDLDSVKGIVEQMRQLTSDLAGS